MISRGGDQTGRRLLVSPGQQPEQRDAGDLEEVHGLPSPSSCSGGDVDHGTQGQHAGQRYAEREHPPGADGLPGGDQEADGEGGRPAAQFTGGVDGVATGSDQQGGQGHHELGQRHHDEAPPGGLPLWIAELRSVGGHDGGGQVRDRLGGDQAGDVIDLQQRCREVRTADAAGKMTVQNGRFVRRGLAVQSSGQQIPTLSAAHDRPVERAPGLVPVSRGSDDRLDELALQAARGDRVALSDLVRGTQADVWRLCAHLVDRQSADDLTQDVYSRAITALPRFRGDSPVRLWLLGITRHVCVDEVRRRTRRRRILARNEPGDVEVVLDPTGWVDLDDLLQGLEPDQRAAFVLTQVLGLRYSEAAEAVGCPVGTIRSRVSRAREALVSALAEAPPDQATAPD